MKKMILIAGALIIFLASMVVILVVVNSASKNPLPQGTVLVGGQEIKVDIADNMLTRERGLSGREKLEENEGMLFIFSYATVQSFWMKDMNFPLDMIWIMDDTIVGITENVPPPSKDNPFNLPSYPSPQSVNKVLEVNAGTSARLGLKTGDKVQINLD